MADKKGFLAYLFGVLARQAEQRGYWMHGQSSDPALARSGFWSSTSATSTGMQVNETTAYTYSVFWACVNNISTDIASFPLNLYKRESNGGKTLLQDHKLFSLLHDSPNPEMTAFTFRGLLTSNALTYGMGYAEIVRNGSGQVHQLWPITPDRVNVRRDDLGRLYFQVTRADGGSDVLRQDQMFVLPSLTHDGVSGRNIVHMARESIGLGLAAERFGGTFYGNGSTFGGVFEHPTRMSDKALENFRQSVNAQHQGVEKAHKFIVTEEGMKFQRLTVDQNAAQFIETRQHQVEEMCRWFRMPPHKVQHLIRTSYNSVEQMNIEYSSDTLQPRCVCWEQELLRQLIAPSERRIQFFKHNMDSKLRGDTAARYEAYAKGIQNGFLSADDVREKEDMNPLPDGAGKKYFIQSNNQPLDRVDEIVDKQVAPDPKPQAPQAPAAKSDDDEEKSQRMVEEIRTALAAVESRIADTAAKITTVEMDNLSLKEAKSELEVDASGLRAQLAKEQAEANQLRVLLMDATERAGQIAAEHEATQRAADDLRAQAEAAQFYAEAAKTATALELERVTAELNAMAARAAQVEADQRVMHQTVVAADLALTKLQADLVAAEARYTVTSSELETERGALKAAWNQVEQLRTAIAEAQQERDAVDADRVAKMAEAATSAAKADEAHQKATEAAEKLRKATDEAEAARQLLEEETAARVEAEQAQEAIRSALDTATATVYAEKRAAAQALEEATANRLATEQALAETVAKLEAEQALRAAAEAALPALKATYIAKRQATITARRKVIATAASKVLVVECDRARRNQTTPAKLLAWAESFYMGPVHEDRFVDALRDIMQEVLIDIDSDVDVDTYTRNKVRPQLLAAVAQIRAVASGDPEEFPVALEHLLTRWERERPAAIADAVVQEEMTYVRSL